MFFQSRAIQLPHCVLGRSVLPFILFSCIGRPSPAFQCAGPKPWRHPRPLSQLPPTSRTSAGLLVHASRMYPGMASLSERPPLLLLRQPLPSLPCLLYHSCSEQPGGSYQPQPFSLLVLPSSPSCSDATTQAHEAPNMVYPTTDPAPTMPASLPP